MNMVLARPAHSLAPWLRRSHRHPARRPARPPGRSAASEPHLLFDRSRRVRGWRTTGPSRPRPAKDELGSWP